MTARHVLAGGCYVRVRVGSETHQTRKWVFWGGSELAADIGVIKLPRVSRGHIFRFRTAPPPFGTNLGMVGHPLGNRVSLNQGKVVRRFKLRGVPIMAVRMLGAVGASGSPFVDDQGRVNGILQIGLGGNETSGVLLGVELSTAWGKGPRHALCRAFPKGGVPGCAVTDPPPPPREPEPPPPPAPPPSTDYKVRGCWVQHTGGDPTTIDISKKLYQVAGNAELLANGHDKYATVIALEANAVEPMNVKKSLYMPNGRLFSTGTISWEPGYSLYWGTLAYTWAIGGFFWQRPEIATTASPGWRFLWEFPDGQTCTWILTVT